jgi:histidinol-phosphatase
MDRHELVLGVSSAPVYGETMWASTGGGAWFEGERVRVAETTDMAQAAISIGNVRTLAGDERWAALGGLIRDANRIRGYGDFCHYHLLARGSLDLVIESDVNILDIAALAVIVREAGGVFTDLHGAPPTLDTTSVLAGTPAIHAQALQRLRR